MQAIIDALRAAMARFDETVKDWWHKGQHQAQTDVNNAQHDALVALAARVTALEEKTGITPQPIDVPADTATTGTGSAPAA